jgi:hypothetical protein
MKPLLAVALLYATTKYCSGAHIGTDKGGSFVSPNQHYAVIIAPTVMPGSSAVLLRVVDARKQSVLFYSHAGGRGIDVLWSPRSDEVAINSYEANSGETSCIFSVLSVNRRRVFASRLIMLPSMGSSESIRNFTSWSVGVFSQSVGVVNILWR